VPDDQHQHPLLPGGQYSGLHGGKAGGGAQDWVMRPLPLARVSLSNGHGMRGNGQRPCHHGGTLGSLIWL
jgi:hypothetical protein